MSRTVDNLLTLAQVDEGRLDVLRSRVDVAKAAEAAALPLRPLADHKQIRVAIDGHPAETYADPQHLHLALTNLIENAIKFTPEGGEVQVLGVRVGLGRMPVDGDADLLVVGQRPPWPRRPGCAARRAAPRRPARA